MRGTDGDKGVEMLPDVMEEPQRASNDDASHGVPNEADLESSVQYFSHLSHLNCQSLAATVQALLRLADVRYADVDSEFVVDFQALFEEDQVVAMGLEAVDQHYYVLAVTCHRLRRDDVASFVYFLEDFDALRLFFKLVLSLYQKGLVPQLQLML